MEANYAPGIVVLNKKYFPRDSLSAAQVGATSFTLSVLRVLHNAGILCGIVLYERNENLEEAYCHMETYLYDNTIPVATVSFNFRLSQPSVACALGEAFSQTLEQSRRNVLPIVYYQTDTILHYHPSGYRFCVTHHGPFVSDFRQSFSRSLTQLAFGGDVDKIDILEKQQRLGIDRLLTDGLGTVLAHSGLQQRVLEDQGLHSSRFRRLRAPIGNPQSGNTDLLSEQIKKFVSDAEILIFTTVARLDYFKNIELFIKAGVELLDRAVPVRVLAVGDPDSDDSRRQNLMEMVPVAQRQQFLILPRLPKDHLYALFSAARRNGVFICPSRYETLGITPLEAAASGVVTLIADSKKVEATSYLPASCRVMPDTRKIAAKVQVIYYGGVSKWANMVQEHILPETSLEVFRDDLLQAWESMSTAAQALFSTTDSVPEHRIVDGDELLENVIIKHQKKFVARFHQSQTVVAIRAC